ncbi:MAG: CDP-alcohol phosphatidyltransferase family protein [Tannerella sp.]|jgi:hypothetical protein|nr:CDP-alcohol phosphatidyltransferase family protein [Tannerella sp.]
MTNDTNIAKEYEASLKSIETENCLDRWFYRPVGFRIARALRGSGITPNAITIISIFVGAAAGPLFYYDNIYFALVGILALILANILDCVDGQLARLTGIKSEIGRILDGFAGDVWFLCIYISLALRMNREYDTSLFFIPAALSAISHLVQANITDYYKTVHLFFISPAKGSELQSAAEVRLQYSAMKPGVSKMFFFFYKGYTALQESKTPRLQSLLAEIRSEHGGIPTEDCSRQFRHSSKRLMTLWIDYLTFNGRFIAIVISVLSGVVWLYFLIEIAVLNFVLYKSIHLHEKLCNSLLKK